MRKVTYYVVLMFFTFNMSLLNASTIQKVRIDFTGPDGYIRHLLLGFTSNNVATDGYDYGYDALNMDNFPNDLNWMIDNDRFVIQGVGAYEATKYYRLGMFLNDSGNIQISLNALEDFDQEIPVYVYDSLADSYTLLNSFDFNLYLTDGDYENRFFLTFSNAYNYMINGAASALSVDDNLKGETKIVYYQNLKQLVIQSSNGDTIIEELSIYDLSGKQVLKKLVNDRMTILRSEVSSGLYVVHLTTEKNETLSKLITL